jgi:hypothetical protein
MKLCGVGRVAALWCTQLSLALQDRDAIKKCSACAEHCYILL